ncbi:Holliday junction ATP-dependent DNA helicase RuvA [Flavobacteriales bacterium]|nr:Holliday junction ATP-dependent DNA helicase RuvA [Flavobacteriales bacterium]MCL4815440.1 Holliday junction branch migration protein RuvA [Flavobacteriales bacterium]WKZ75059.1 MAG: Holliday junction branch migration protein RuvA [Vicingaceae bacterium]GIK70001.1 MAG: Holliday junction ATP-dependent DNA helicase RuvA [Bacteroidota bacterium]CAG0958934.1 Holliday junction ATP-dependent DNA helicase RuvA [Flavobacteriales bacterium]
MIAYIEGKIFEKTPTYVIINCAGVGYLVNISLNTFSKLPGNDLCKLHTHLIVREDAHLLYGFAEKSEKELFLQLISVSGVGAATAILILSSLSAAEIKNAIISKDVNLLKSIKGIGTKSAERIIIDLRDKLMKGDHFSPQIINAQNNTSKEEALSALVMLGFSKIQTEKVVNQIIASNTEASVEEIIKKALKAL